MNAYNRRRLAEGLPIREACRNCSGALSAHPDLCRECLLAEGYTEAEVAYMEAISAHVESFVEVLAMWMRDLDAVIERRPGAGHDEIAKRFHAAQLTAIGMTAAHDRYLKERR